MGLFQLGQFTLRSGQTSDWKIEAGFLTFDDWAGLARMAVDLLPPFGSVVGVPTGGIPFALALGRYASGDDHHPVLIAEDVYTTGGSMERFRAAHAAEPHNVLSDYVGIAAFARTGVIQDWIHHVFLYNFTMVKDKK